MRESEWSSADIQTISRHIKYEVKWENNEEENGLMVMQDMIGWRRGDRTGLEFPPSYPFFSPTLFSDLFCSNALQRRSRGKSAPCSRSWKQTSLRLHPNELLSELVLHSYHRKHMQILISGVQVRPFSQTHKALPTLNTSVYCNSP